MTFQKPCIFGNFQSFQKYAAKIIDETSITFYLITINMEPELIEKSLLTKSVKAVISGLGQKHLITKLNELINMV